MHVLCLCMFLDFIQGISQSLCVTRRSQNHPCRVRTRESHLLKVVGHAFHKFQYMRLSEQKPDMFALKLKFILLPQLIATLNNYACSLPPLANVYWSAFLECFLLTM